MIKKILLIALVLYGVSAFSGFDFDQKKVNGFEVGWNFDLLDMGMFRGDGTFGTANDLMFQDLDVTTPVSLRTLVNGAALGFLGRYTIGLTHNGVINNGTFYGYSNLLPGDSTPVVIPKNSALKDITWANSSDLADYTLKFRKNSTTATPFLTISKTNTQFFQQVDIDESFLAGDRIFLEHIKDGNNSSDIGFILFFQNN